MENKLVFHPRAKAELSHALDWYEKQQPGLEKRFWSEYATCMEGILSNPALFPVIHKKYRRLVMRNFPYNIIYNYQSPTIIVIAVFHQKRNPVKWKKR